MAMTPEEIDYYKNLAKIMFKTRGCRFNAAEAAASKDRWSVATVAFLSVYLLALSIFSMSYPEYVNESRARIFNSFSAITSVALLVITLMDFAFSRAVRAEKLQGNALEISCVMREMERELKAASPNEEILKRCANNYERAIAETGINHTSMDLTKWSLMQRGKENAGMFILSILYNKWYYISTMFIYPMLIAFCIIPTAYYVYRIIWPTVALH